MSIREQVLDIVSVEMGVPKDQLKDGTSFVQDLNADSLDIVEPIMYLEDEFGLDIDDKEIQTVGDVVKTVEGLTGK